MAEDNKTLLQVISIDSVTKGSPKREEVTLYGDGAQRESLAMQLFQERGYGHHVFFHPSVLGMQPVYNVTGRVVIGPEKVCETIRTGPYPVECIQVPDPAVMDELEMTMPAEEFGRLKEFYAEFARKTSKLGEGYLTLSDFDERGGVHYAKLENHFEERTALTHNGVVVPSHPGIATIQSGDLIKVGPAILLGYVFKDRSPSGEETGRDLVRQ